MALRAGMAVAACAAAGAPVQEPKASVASWRTRAASTSPATTSSAPLGFTRWPKKLTTSSRVMARTEAGVALRPYGCAPYTSRRKMRSAMAAGWDSSTCSDESIRVRASSSSVAGNVAFFTTSARMVRASGRFSDSAPIETRAKSLSALVET